MTAATASVRALLLLGLAVAALFLPGVSRAQGVGDFVSPGPLSTPHAHLSGITQCTECHAPGMGPAPDRCLACHDDVQKQVDRNKGFHAGKGDKCATCHPDHRGADFPLVTLNEEKFDHAKETGFELAGAHRWLECTDCHESGDWAGLDQKCATCHLDPHQQVNRGRNLLGECDSCHTAVDWEVQAVAVSVLDHTDPKQVDYVLEGAHRTVDCVECHVDAVFVPTAYKGGCTDCHDSPHRAAFASQKTCSDCHAVRSWLVRSFDHNLTGYALEGLHTEVGCEDCHGNSRVRRKAHDTCKDCHTDVHNGQFDPRPCDTCHSVNVAAFALAEFDHDNSDFPLRGKHIEVECAECHGEGPDATWTGVEHADCDSCHEDTHEGSFEPTPCKVCHAENGWGVEDFDHDRTDFPLVGEHLKVECESCHPNEQWSDIAHESCLDCHSDDNPHGPSLDAASCADCHTSTGWLTIFFEHLAQTGYDLEPRHGDVGCLECHKTAEVFAGLDTTCNACHLESRPFGHYSGDCETCHRASDWVPADIGEQDHAITGFPLRGAHALASCDDCHGGPGTAFGAAEPTCVSCHADDDVHRNMLGQQCADCHTEVAWFRTRFRHQQTGWPLRGAHRLAACVDCHAVSYAGTPQDCRACHEAEASFDVPAHRSSFFSQCDSCHRPYTWSAVSLGSTTR